jgi:hypothetical protein
MSSVFQRMFDTGCHSPQWMCKSNVFPAEQAADRCGRRVESWRRFYGGVQLPVSTQSEAAEGGRQGISELQRCLALQCQSVVNKVLMLTVRAVSSSSVEIRPQSAKKHTRIGGVSNDTESPFGGNRFEV